jgi:hypothetical protein
VARIRVEDRNHGIPGGPGDDVILDQLKVEQASRQIAFLASTHAVNRFTG